MDHGNESARAAGGTAKARGSEPGKEQKTEKEYKPNGSQGPARGSYNHTDPDRPRRTKDAKLVATYDYYRGKDQYSYTVLKYVEPDGNKTFQVGRKNFMSFSDRQATGQTAD